MAEQVRRRAQEGQWVGVGAIVLGAILSVIPGTQAAGAYFVAWGTVVTTASSIAISMNAPEPEDPKERRERSHITPPRIGEGYAIPVVYGRRGDFVPIITQAYLTPADKKGELKTGPGAVPSNQQAMSMMCVCGEGPYPKDWLEMVYVNDQPIWSEVTGDRVGTTNGTLKEWVFPRRQIRMESLKVYLDGVEQNHVDTSATVLVGFTTEYSGVPPVPVGLRTFYTFKADSKTTVIDFDTIVLYLCPKPTYSVIEANRIDASTYTIQAKNDRTFDIKFSTAPEGLKYIVATFDYTDDASPGAFKLKQNEHGVTRIIFGTAPLTGAELTYDATIDNFPELTLETRRGEINQAPLDGANEVRNSYPVGDLLAEKEAITVTTERDVDDVSITLAALQGMIRYGQYGQKMSSIARITVDYRKHGDTPWISLPNPKGNTSPEFKLEGETPLLKRWDISIRDTLKEAAKVGLASQDQLEDFDRDRYDIRVVRLDAPTDVESNQDSIWLSHVTEVQDEKLSYPGVVYFVIHGLASSKLRGSIPQISVKLKGRIVKNLDTGVEEWSQNPAWCCADLLTNTRFGAGVAEADLITQDWIDFADFCDETVDDGNGGTEARCLMDAILYDARPPLAQLNDLMFGAFAAPRMDGKHWGVFIDEGQDDPDKVYYYSGASSNQEMGSLSVGIETREKSPTEIEVQYTDAELDYEPHELLIPPAWRTSTDRMKKTISLPGVTRRSQVVRVGERVLQSVDLQPLVCEFVALPDGCLSEAGDVIFVLSDTGDFPSGKKWRVLRVGIDARCRVRLLCREYSDALYASHPYSLSVKSTPNPRTETNQRPGQKSRDPTQTIRKGRLVGIRPRVKLRELTKDTAS